MKRFILSMPDELAAQVEAYRVRAGLKSTAEAHRTLIMQALDLRRGVLRKPPEDMKVTHTTITEPYEPHSTVGFSLVRPKPGSLLKKR